MTDTVEITKESSSQKEERKEEGSKAEASIQIDSILDVAGLTCPMPIVKLKKGIDELQSNQVLELLATDKGILTDLPAWTKKVGHQILKTEQEGSIIKFWIKKK